MLVMAFSQSLDMGNSTLQDLESQARRAVFAPAVSDAGECQNKNLDNAGAGVDIIEESPTQQRSRACDGLSVFSKTRPHHPLNSPNSGSSMSDKARRRFRRSKSDSTLAKAKTQQTDNNYTDFFRSDFSFSPVLEELKCKQDQEPVMLRVSQIEAVIEQDEETPRIDGNESADLDKPIFSEDLKDLLNTEEGMEERVATDSWHDSLPLSAIPEAILNGVKDEMPALDVTSFICPALNDEAIEQLEKEIQASRIDVQRECIVLNQPRNHSDSINDSMNCRSQNYSSRQTTGTRAALQSAKCATHASDANVASNTSMTDNVSDDLESLRHISAWHLPHSVLQEYEKKGVVKMFDWQVQCLSNPKVLFEYCNLVYSAPTSAGKSLISEILLLKTVLERKKKALFILPFISVVREKMFYLQDLLVAAGYRVEGFFGGYTPPGGFDSIHVAICTIEKANSIINKLLEQGKLSDIGTVVVDEVHLISDPGRGYILELLLAKVLYMSRKYGLQIQIITMSATLANVELLKRWLDAELYITDFRPVALQEMIKVGNKIYNTDMNFLRDVTQPPSGEETAFPVLQNDSDHVAQLCIETLLEGCSVIVFCPSKDWCENLAVQLAGAIHSVGKMNDNWSKRLREHINREAINEVKRRLHDIPTGLDAILEKTITYACAFHHAGLTSEERDIVEASFKSGTLKIIVATSTLSSGVNLPARRVLIRTPLFGGKQMSSLTYRQMIGRAGRTGKDTRGESILICTESNARIGRELITNDLQPIRSCLEMDSSTHLKRALLEVISSGVASIKDDIDNFVSCTLLSAEKQLKEQGKDNSNSGQLYISDALNFLKEYEFVRLQTIEATNDEMYVATRLGMACLAASMPPTDGLILFSELQRSRRCFVLESELHAVYLVTPYSVCYQMPDLDWLLFLDLWEKLSPSMKRVGELVGVKESFLVRAMRGQTKLDYKLMQIHKRFYTALALQELVNEIPINVVANKYKCTRGMLQSLQQMASTFAGIVTAFCNSLQWPTLSLIVEQFKERLYFGIHRDLIDLMRLPELSHKRARSLFDAGITSLVELANADVSEVEKILYNSLSFDSTKQQEHENAYENEKRNLERNYFITGRTGLTAIEAAKLLVEEARKFIQYEIGVGGIKWTQKSDEENRDRHVPEEIEKSESLRKRGSLEDQTGNTIEVTAPKVKKMEEEKPCTSREALKCSRQRNIIKVEPVVAIMDNKVGEENQKIVNGKKADFKTEIKVAHTRSCAKNKSHEGNIIENCKNIVDETEALKSVSRNLRGKENEENAVGINCKTFELTRSTEKFEQKTKRYQLRNSTENNQQNHILPDNVKNNTPDTKINKQRTKLKVMQHVTQTVNMQPQPRRSPRNHKVELKQFEATKISSKSEVREPKRNTSNCIGELMLDESFELNTGINEALDRVDNMSPVLAKHSADTSKIFNTSHDEVPNSQDLCKDLDKSNGTTPCSRFLRSSRTLIVDSSKNLPKSTEISPVEPTNSSSIELSDFSLENSLIKDPVKLNASHILSCSKEDTDASNLNCIEIVDICGDENLFKAAFKEIMTAKRVGFCVGLQQQESKRKPLIGSNLLINQMKNKEQSNAPLQSVLFQIDDISYMAGCSFSMGENVVYFMNMQDEGTCKGLTAELKCKYLRMLLREKENTLLIYDTKDQLKVLQRAIPNLDEICVNFEDPKVGNWLLQPEKTMSFQQMTHQFAPECTALVRLCGSGRGYNSFGLDIASAIYAKVRCSVEACVTVHVLKGIIENLERIGSGQLYKFFKELEMPLQLSLCAMEMLGFPANENALRNLFQQMVETLKKLENKIYEMHGSRFNLGSSASVAKVVGLHRKGNGRFCTSRQILEKSDSPISQFIILYRKISTTLAKNIQPLLKCVRNNRIHGQSITFTLTGRISMTEPNLQNVAKDFDVHLGVAEKITISCRSAFYPSDPGRCLLSSDFCQLEMRILAHLSQDAALLQIMNTEKDIFRAMAARWNRICESDVSEQLRNGTKQICYGIVYGMGMRSLAEALKCTEQEAILLSEQFHAAYPGIRAYTEKVVKFARNNGYIETITGRRRYLEHINSGEPHLKSQAERQAINSTIQGSAADIAKSAILRIEKNIEKYRKKLGIAEHAVRLVLHVHDELIYDVPEEKAKKVAKVLSITMENCVKLSVPLRVKLKMGRSWGDLKEVKL